LWEGHFALLAENDSATARLRAAEAAEIARSLALLDLEMLSRAMWKGDWTAAEAELVAAAQELTAVRPAMQSEATVRLAELRRRQGRFDEAEILLREAEGYPLAFLVSAAVALDKGDGIAASDLAERFLRGVVLEDRTERLAGLEVRARALLTLGKAARPLRS
jgi:hypothetical protein